VSRRRAADPGKPLVFVTVGTDHHPFDRLVGWIDGWLDTEAGSRVSCLVQSGTSRPPALAEHRDYVSYQEMEENLARAVAVVCHGGPASVMMARWAGKRPVVVPREHRFGEHVDDHQVVFSRRLATEGDIAMALDEPAFRAALEEALAGAGAVDRQVEASRVAEAVSRFERLVDGMFEARR
jgi:UDP-N-acetylglucosamine transferase subunit ALG13